MMRHLVLILLTVLTGCAQQAPTVSSSGKCSPNVVDNKGRVQFTCNVKMDKVTAEKMATLLNEVLQKQDEDTDETNRKLDSILEFLQTNMNPNRPVVTYDCAGSRFTKGPSADSANSINAEYGAKKDVWQKMAELNNSRNFSALLEECSRQMKSTPEWLTPYLFCAVANLNLGNGIEAKRLVVYYDEHKGPNYEGGSECQRMSDGIRSHLPKP